MKKFLTITIYCIFTCIISLLTLFPAPLLYAADVTLGWDANTEADLAGYYVYYKTGSFGPPYNGTGAVEGNSPIQAPIANLVDPENPDYTIHGLSDTQTTYFVLTAYDTGGNESGFSNEVSYDPPKPGDTDNDGLPDEEEQGPSGTNPNYDGNGDNIADFLQDNVVSLHTHDSQNYVTLRVPDGIIINNCQAKNNPSSGNTPSNVEFPYGFFEFTIEGLGIGGATTVTLYLPDGETFDTYYKFGPTPIDGTNHWYEFLDDGQTGAQINGDVINLNFVDGLRGDDDLKVDKIVINIGGPGVSLNPGVEINGGNLVTSELWIKAVINTLEKGPIQAVWKKGGEDTTSQGDRVIWGYFYANPSDVTWGSENNPDLFVKIWFDVSGRVDVNYFHVSVPDVEVYSNYPYDGTTDEQGTTTTSRRYIRQYYEGGQSYSDENYEDGNPTFGYSPAGNPSGYSTINDLRIGSIINTVAKGPIDAVWSPGGQVSTSRGNQVFWGYFYTNPSDVTWGSQNNPDLFVKIWFDVSGRVDVNFFHASVPNIEVYSDFPSEGTYDQKGITIMDNRYIRHEYWR